MYHINDSKTNLTRFTASKYLDYEFMIKLYSHINRQASIKSTISRVKGQHVQRNAIETTITTLDIF
jgi:hypothetical protein